MAVDVLLGLQWGDEGKGKIVDFLAHNYDIIARFQGGPNAGHTLYYNNNKIVLHHIPSGVFHPNLINFIGNGVVLHPTSFKAEFEKVEATGVNLRDKLFIAKKAHLIMPTHTLLDAASEAAKGKQKIGSTLRGIGPTYRDKIGRNGLRVGDILAPDFKQRYDKIKASHERLLNTYDFDYSALAALEAEWFDSIALLQSLSIVEGEFFINQYIAEGKRILAEGAQGSMLDIDFGTYPFVTSSNTISAGVCNGLGIAPQHIKEVFGVTKAYCTRVGSGPFPTELHDEMGERIRQEGKEFGATTGRPRRCGWIDLPALRYAIMLSGVTQLVVTKADVLSVCDTIAACNTYEIQGEQTTVFPFDLDDATLKMHYKHFDGWKSNLDNIDTFEALPEQLQTYLNYIQNYLGVPITLLSTGPKRDELVHRASTETILN